MDDLTIKLCKKFSEFSEGTREDFHEPTEAGIEFTSFVGTNLDNAMGNAITNKEAVVEGYQECIVTFRKEVKNGKGGYKGEYYTFNLANLLALAKHGAKKIIEENK